MLTLTENASTIVKTLTDRSDVGGEAGLRISSREPESRDFAVELSPQPREFDTVVEEAGARVFLEQNAAISLDDKVLDAQISAEGAVQFSIGDRPAI